MAGWNFRKSLRIGKVLRISLGGKSVGLSVGVKGARAGVNSSRGAYTHLSIPGTGLYNRSYLGTGTAKIRRSATFCEKCGARLPQGANFCGTCGAPVK